MQVINYYPAYPIMNFWQRLRMTVYSKEEGQTFAHYSGLHYFLKIEAKTKRF